MYRNHLYPQPLYVNLANRYEPTCCCHRSPWNQNLQNGMFVNPSVIGIQNYPVGNNAFVSPMNDNNLNGWPMNEPIQNDLYDNMYGGTMNDLANDNMYRDQMNDIANNDMNGNMYGSPVNRTSSNNNENIDLRDHGMEPYVVNIEEAAERNNNYRTALWTGDHFQVTLMSINVGEDIGLEVHPETDQFLRIEEGQGLVQMGETEDNLAFQRGVTEDDAIMVPAGQWHNLTNTGNTPLKLYVIYAPPEHPFGTVHRTKADAF